MRLRVSLPDRPGALGQVARALGALGADIHQVTVLDREAGRAVDDFTVSWPGAPDQDEVRDRLSAVPGVHVEGAWHTREVPGSAPDYDLLRHVAAEPVRAFTTLVDALPDLVGADWALTVPAADVAPGARPAVVHRSWRAPEVLELREPLSPRAAALRDGDVRLMSVPLADTGLWLFVGRAEGVGLAFHRAELDRVVRLTEIITMLARTGRAAAVAAAGVGAEVEMAMTGKEEPAAEGTV
ncbi:ACT domain-containing protein [Thermocatellispora tengchongensis]|nr:ACT domain-containing protein [Thermocatellispora tengchongensis]